MVIVFVLKEKFCMKMLVANETMSPHLSHVIFLLSDSSPLLIVLSLERRQLQETFLSGTGLNLPFRITICAEGN
jgi:hypothetical protein